MTLVSAIVPMYNGKSYIGECIQSLQESDYVNEVIVVDDGSTDGSQQFVRDRFPSVALIEQGNRGVSAARNVGLAVSVNSYVIFIDQDDRLVAAGLAELVEALKANPQSDFLYGDYVQINEDGSPCHRVHQPDVTSDPIRKLVETNCSSSVCCLYRRSKLNEVSGFDEGMMGCEDWDLYLRLAIARASMIYVPTPIYEFRFYGTSTSKNFAIMWNCFKLLESKHRSLTLSFPEGEQIEKKRRDRFLNDNLRHLYGAADETWPMLKRRWNRTKAFMKVLVSDRYLASNLIRRAVQRPK